MLWSTTGQPKPDTPAGQEMLHISRASTLLGGPIQKQMSQQLKAPSWLHEADECRHNYKILVNVFRVWFIHYSVNIRKVGRFRRQPWKGELQGAVTRTQSSAAFYSSRFLDRIYQLFGLFFTLGKGLLKDQQWYKCPLVNTNTTIFFTSIMFSSFWVWPISQAVLGWERLEGTWILEPWIGALVRHVETCLAPQYPQQERWCLWKSTLAANPEVIKTSRYKGHGWRMLARTVLNPQSCS